MKATTTKAGILSLLMPVMILAQTKGVSAAMKARSSIVFLAILLTVCAVPANTQTPITIQNPSFETFNPLIYGNPPSFNSGPIPGWVTSGQSGSWQPGTIAFTSRCDGAIVVWLSGTLTQDLGIAAVPNSTYTLTACAGHRADSTKDDTSGWVISLLAGTSVLGSISGQNSVIPVGTFVQQTLTVNTGATVPPGNLIVSLAKSGTETIFDAVALTVQTGPSIAVSVAPASSTVLAGQTGTFTATVLNDSANAGVNWTVSSSGSVSPTSTASGAQTTYTAPQFVPANNQVILTATSVTDPTKSGTATITIPHQAALSWTDSANPAGSVTYSVLRSAANPSIPFCPAVLSASYTQLVSGLTVMNYTDATIAASTSYCYEVVAVANNQSGIAGVILFVPGSVTTITVSSLYPWFYNQLIQPMTTLTVKQIS